MSIEESRRPLTAELLAALVGGRAALTAIAVTQDSPSTNTELLTALAADPQQWPHMSAFVADHQTEGRGRAGRVWQTPAGAAITVSFVLRPDMPEDKWGLVPLAAGLAVVHTLRSDGVDAWLKWPNDVVVPVDGPEVPGWAGLRKVAGILCERRADAVVAGVGINVSQRAEELPVPHATSLALLGARNLDRYALLEALADAIGYTLGDAETSAEAFLAAVEAVTATIGMDVVVERPGQPPLTGVATGIAPDGALKVRTSRGETVTVIAGDVRVRVAQGGPTS